MPSAVIELVLGLIFVFFLFSMLCSGINELIARALGKRADFLAAGLWSLLDNSKSSQPDGKDRADDSNDRELSGGDDTDKYFSAFQQHPLVKQLGQAVSDAQQGEPGRIRGKWRSFCARVRKVFTGKSLKDAMAPVPYDPRQVEGRRARPSYIPPAIFGTVVASFLRETNDLPNMPAGHPETEDERAAAERRRTAGTPLQKSLQALVDDAAGDVHRLRASLERWYDAQMERVSGWYKRESKRILLALAILVVLMLNVDTVAIARTLWTNPTARGAVADAAAGQIQAAATTTTTLLSGAPGRVTPPAEQPTALPALVCPDENAPEEETAPTTATPNGSGELVAQALDCARSLPIPIGWRLAKGDPWNEAWESFIDAFFWGWVLKLLGWGLTVGALTFGAPFWFDLLNRFGSLRAAGVKPRPSTETGG